MDPTTTPKYKLREAMLDLLLSDREESGVTFNAFFKVSRTVISEITSIRNQMDASLTKLKRKNEDFNRKYKYFISVTAQRSLSATDAEIKKTEEDILKQCTKVAEMVNQRLAESYKQAQDLQLLRLKSNLGIYQKVLEYALSTHIEEFSIVEIGKVLTEDQISADGEKELLQTKNEFVDAGKQIISTISETEKELDITIKSAKFSEESIVTVIGDSAVSVTESHSSQLTHLKGTLFFYQKRSQERREEKKQNTKKLFENKPYTDSKKQYLKPKNKIGDEQDKGQI